MINTNGLTYSTFTQVICRLYLVSCIVVVYFGLFYVLGDSYFTKKIVKTYKVISGVLLVVGSLLALTLDLDVVYDPNGLNDYTEGLPIVISSSSHSLYSIFFVILLNIFAPLFV